MMSILIPPLRCWALLIVVQWASGHAEMINNVADIPSAEVLRRVLRDAVGNVIFVVIGTLLVIAVGSASRTLGLILAAIETLLAAFESIKVIFLVLSTVFLDLGALLGKYTHDDDQAPMRWSLLIRIVELVVLVGCILILYRFFFR
jgi:phosphate starvation-inducible membrane PsiE